MMALERQDTIEPNDADALTCYAGFWIRFAAYTIDVVVMLIPLNLLRFLMKAGVSPETYDAAGAELMVSIVWWIYCAVLESSPWQGTVGKKVLGLVVTDLNGKRIGFGRATGRFFAELLSFLLLAIGVLMVGWTQKKQGLHDMMAGTLVLKKRH
jgi:uncharacterized RDD family membrane protein YckC